MSATPTGPTGPIIQADNNSAICKSTPNQVNTLLSTLSSCRSTVDSDQLSQIVQKLTNYGADFDQLNATYNDLILAGDNLYGSSSSSEQIQQIKLRNEELRELKEKLEKQIQAAESRSEQMNRDFIDMQTEQPQPLPNKTLHVLEDYTVAVLSITWLFMVIGLVYLYTYTAGFTAKSVLIGIVSGGIATLIAYALLFLLV
jgi:prefoldin subunit 5